MNATRTSARRLTATVILLALAGSADSVAEGTTKIVQGVHETAKGIGQTLTEGTTTVEQRLKAAGAERRSFPAEALDGQLR